jgi:hypothetical protein
MQPELGQFQGRVEHLNSAQALRFTSVEELLAFMGRILSDQQQAEVADSQEDSA